MNKENISKAIGEIDSRHINEAINYHSCRSLSCKTSIFRKPFGRFMIAIFCICLLIGFSMFMPFDKQTIKAYAYGTDKKIMKTNTVLSSGTITDDGEMKGPQVQFYIVGNGIKTIRFSCKNQWIDFVDWTGKRNEFGMGKNFTVPYGSDESEYCYLIIDWIPDYTIRMLTDNKNVGIKDLPIKLRKDIVVLEITYENGKSATKAIKINLQDNGKFAASFDDYTITKQDKFVKCPDSKPINNDVLHAHVNDSVSQSTDKGCISYQAALSKQEIEEAKTAALDYYKNTVWHVESIDVTSDDNRQYKNIGIEANYSAGNIIIFNVTAICDGKTENRTISVVRTKNGNWSVINEGF
jgi:hypothetical protein